MALFSPPTAGADLEKVEWWLTEAPLAGLLAAAAQLRDQAHEGLVTFSPKVFIPLTHLCRDNCGYCTFAHPPRPGESAYMSIEAVLAVARAGAAAGCREALFTLGDRPEKRHPEARAQLEEMGFATTIDYLVHAAGLVLAETGLLPHTNPGVTTREEMAALRRVAASQGLMLESVSERLLERGEAHWASPDKRPEARLQVMEDARTLDVPFTTGLLIGIGETVAERAATLGAIAAAGGEHIQEVIVQNFRAKAGTLMQTHSEPGLEEMLRSIAAARLLLGAEASIQAPPNLQPGHYGRYLEAGINDWGGVSPVTADHVNPEAPWPQLQVLAAESRRHGLELTPRLAVYPAYAATAAARERWLDPALRGPVLRLQDAEGLARPAERWFAGLTEPPPENTTPGGIGRTAFRAALARAEAGHRLAEGEIETLFRARGPELGQLTELADAVRREVSGNQVTFAVVRNINYTNICYFHCGFCAFSKGTVADLRGPAQLMGIDEVVERSVEAHRRGATEVCLQGGIHPDFTGDFYLEVCRRIKAAVPELHIHAFSALEVWQGATTLGLPLREYLARLRAAGLATLPGTAAEILSDDIRDLICPDKLRTGEWVEVIEAAHREGLRTTSTIMFGSVEGPAAWARHLVVLRDLQDRTGGITEFVPLPFVHMEAPIYRRGQSRRGPTFAEALKMHAVARLALRGSIDNIQTSWVKMGLEGALAALSAGANDFGGTLMNESISRAAGASHGQEMTPENMVAAIRSIGRVPVQRNTLYGVVRRFDD